MLKNKKYDGICFDCNSYKELTNPNDSCVKCGGLYKISGRYGICDCGEEIEFSHFTNSCPNCGRDYNSSGHLLADRSQWGEETGESLSDILNIR